MNFNDEINFYDERVAENMRRAKALAMEIEAKRESQSEIDLAIDPRRTKESAVPQVKITDEMVEAALGKARERQADTLTVRDQLAMAALQGILSRNMDGILLQSIASEAYHMADAMMEARE